MLLLPLSSLCGIVSGISRNKLALINTPVEKLQAIQLAFSFGIPKWRRNSDLLVLFLSALESAK